MSVSNQQPGPPQPPYQPYHSYPPPPPTPKKRRKWPWVVGGILLVIFIIGAVASVTDPTRTTTSPSNEPAASATPATAATAKPKAPAKPAGPARTMSDGVYQVGVDVQAGRYKTPGPPADDPVDMCYWSRNKNDSGEFEAVITNGIVQGPGSVTVNKGEFIELTGGCTWTKVG